MSSSPYGRCFRPTKCQGNRVGGIKEIEPAEIHNDTGFTIAIDSFLKRCDQMNEVAVRLAEPGDVVFRHACKLGFEGIVSKRLGSPYVSGRSRNWLKFENSAAPAVKREAEEDWGEVKHCEQLVQMRGTGFVC